MEKAFQCAIRDALHGVHAHASEVKQYLETCNSKSDGDIIVFMHALTSGACTDAVNMASELDHIEPLVERRIIDLRTQINSLRKNLDYVALFLSTNLEKKAIDTFRSTVDEGLASCQTIMAVTTEILRDSVTVTDADGYSSEEEEEEEEEDEFLFDQTFIDHGAAVHQPMAALGAFYRT